MEINNDFHKDMKRLCAIVVQQGFSEPTCDEDSALYDEFTAICEKWELDDG